MSGTHAERPVSDLFLTELESVNGNLMLCTFAKILEKSKLRTDSAGGSFLKQSSGGHPAVTSPRSTR